MNRKTKLAKARQMRKDAAPLKTRKEIRRERRKEKKLRRSRQYRAADAHASVETTANTIQNHPSTRRTAREEYGNSDVTSDDSANEEEKESSLSHSKMEEQHIMEKREQKKLLQDMKKSRKQILLAANEEEDRNIRKLEKLLKLDRHKRKSLPKSFVEDGLSYVLDVCNPYTLKESARVEEALQDSGSDFEEDLALIRGSKVESTSRKKYSSTKHTQSESDVDMEEGSDNESDASASGSESDNEVDDVSASGSESDNEVDDVSTTGSQSDNDIHSAVSKDDPFWNKDTAVTVMEESETGKNESNSGNVSDQESHDNFDHEELKANPDSTWEDIYGRTRDKDGNVVQDESQKYIPPALRAKLFEDADCKKKEQLLRLKRQMKGFINRLAENNMASISTQIDQMYLTHSRHDMNSTLFQLSMEALVSTVLTPERLVMEHILLISILHANIGSEVGAYFLQNLIKRFQEALNENIAIENKELDNIILILSHLYNFKVLHASLLFEVLDKIAEVINEKRIELLLVVLRSVGFSLRKDDPAALKNLILKLQKKAGSETDSTSLSGSRMRFMLDILFAIKNNNMSKIPSYDPDHIEHLKKLQRSLVRRGNYITELKITLDDLLKVDERGRWWIVGSAWTGFLPGENPHAAPSQASSVITRSTTTTSYSAQLLELAKKQRMNTGIRKDIFCILMTAEDFMDAFEKLLHLGLKNQQKQEIIHVMFDCCLQEKTFNPFYAHLAQRLCDFDRQFRMMIQYCLWDKLKDVDKLSSSQLGNMAQFLSHLFLEKGLPLSVLKVISFAEMDKASIRLIRQVLLAVLLAKDAASSEAVFHRISVSPKLHLFREGIRLFISHFVLRKSSNKSFSEREAAVLHERVKAAEKALSAADAKVTF